MRSMSSRSLFAGALFIALVPVTDASANERRFTYTYESGTLPTGAVEFEPWTTARIGRESYYLRFDQRLEFEMGLTDALQTAFYINFTGVGARAGGALTESFSFGGVSSEWKLKLLDPVADALGLALYAEIGVGPLETEFEFKVILDKRLGDFLLAFNAVAEIELEKEADKTVTELVAETDLALGYLLSQHTSLGLEIRTHSEFADGKYEHTSLFVGPAFSYAVEKYWIALSVMLQAAAFGGHADGSPDLHEHEQVNARVILGFHL